MLLIDQRGQQYVEPYGLALSCSSCNEQMWHTCQVCYYYLIINSFTQYNGQIHKALHELIRGQHVSEWYYGSVLIGYLDANSSFARNGCNNADAQGSQAQGNIIFEAFNFSNFDTSRGDKLIEGDGRTNRSFNTSDINLKIAQSLHNSLFILSYLLWSYLREVLSMLT